MLISNNLNAQKTLYYGSKCILITCGKCGIFTTFNMNDSQSLKWLKPLSGFCHFWGYLSICCHQYLWYRFTSIFIFFKKHLKLRNSVSIGPFNLVSHLRMPSFCLSILFTLFNLHSLQSNLTREFRNITFIFYNIILF